MKFFAMLFFICFAVPVSAQDMDVFGIDVLQLQISEMEKVVQEQTNTIELLTNRINKMQEQLDNMKVDSEIRFKDIDAKLVPVPAPVSAPIAKIEEKPAVPKNPKEIYDKGVELVLAGKHPEAQLMFEEFLKAAPQDDLAGNAKYWLGETYYARRDYANAAVIFAQGFKEYPKSIKAPDNLLKLGLAMQALKKKDEACTAFKSVISEFPKADKSILDKANKEVKTLGCK